MTQCMYYGKKQKEIHIRTVYNPIELTLSSDGILEAHLEGRGWCHAWSRSECRCTDKGSKDGDELEHFLCGDVIWFICVQDRFKSSSRRVRTALDGESRPHPADLTNFKGGAGIRFGTTSGGKVFQSQQLEYKHIRLNTQVFWKLINTKLIFFSCRLS